MPVDVTIPYPPNMGHVFQGPVTVSGTLNMPDSTITDDKIAVGAAVDAAKLDHQYEISLSQVTGSACTDETKIVHIAKGAGELVAASYVCDVACLGNATIDIDVKKSTGGGAFATLLNAAMQATSSDSDKTVVAGTPAGTATYSAGDIIEITVDATVGTGTLGEGLCVVAYLREAA
jgi:hypothetical protein